MWDKKYPNIAKSWHNHWSELSTFFKYPQSVRTLIYTTNPIESLNAIIKKKTKSKGSFPTQGSALKMVYLATQQIQEKWQRTRVRNWGEIYPQLCIFFDEIMEKYEK
ncbi:MAG: transposase [Candidatus Thiodubiliella endoseptemdiera]|uniref:Mutator family transposase n=1 Tax=Candidatus Thiodubiliella endoseptemdiera TaxID=2738886 RepID=A0A853EZL6_9GAMM|nr:transposase [Candidatus Thiodubiliella endoseptemdiera]